MPQVQILSASNNYKNRVAERRAFLAAELQTLMKYFKGSKREKLRAASTVLKALLHTKANQLSNNKNTRIALLLAAEDLERNYNAIAGESSKPYNPSNQNNSYTDVNLSTSAGKGVKQNQFSHYDYNTCIDQYKIYNPGMPNEWYAKQCIDSLSGFRDVAISQPDKVYHQSTGTGGQVKTTTTLSRQLSNLENSPNTTVHFGSVKGASAMDKAKWAIAKCDEISADISGGGLHSASVQIPAAFKAYDYLYNGPSKESKDSRTRSARKSSRTAAYRLHAYRFNKHYNGAMNAVLESRQPKSNILSASNDNDIPAWIKVQKHVRAKIGAE